MMQVTVTTIRQAESRNRRAVLVVPSKNYHLALLGLACRYIDNAGRTARMDNGCLVSVVTPDTTMERPDDYDLYLCGWGGATRQDEQQMGPWLERARNLYTEIN